MANDLKSLLGNLLLRAVRPIRVNYHFDGRTVTLAGPFGRKTSLRIDELDEIAVETTDQGPFVEDVFWILRRGDVSLRIPEPASIFKPLMDHFRSLDGFDWQPFNEAMTCTDRRRFVCWRHSHEST